jgi:hypothetical protein
MNVRGSKMLKMPLLAEALVPQVVVVNDQAVLDFQDVTIGNSERKVLILQNKGPIAASLVTQPVGSPLRALCSV